MLRKGKIATRLGQFDPCAVRTGHQFLRTVGAWSLFSMLFSPFVRAVMLGATALGALGGCGSDPLANMPPPTGSNSAAVGLQPVALGLSAPLYLTSPTEPASSSC